MPDRLINIKDLILEEPERARELPFDPERDVTEEDWGGMKGELGEFRRTNRINNFIKLASDMKFLFPNRTHEIELGEKEWKKTQRLLQKCRRENRWWNYFDLAVEMRSLFPNRIKDLRLDDEAWSEMKKLLDRERGSRDHWGTFFVEAALVKLLFPSRSNELNLDEEAWGEAKSFALELRDEKSEREDIEHFMRHIRDMRILFPDRFSSFALKEGDWKEMRELFESARKRNWGSFASYASRMKFLIAEEVKITDEGIKIVRQKSKQDFAPQIPPMPEVRRF